MTFTKHLRFYVERRKEYLHGINDRNVVDPVFSRFIGIPRFLDALGVKSGCRFTIPKASVAVELGKALLHTHQHTNDLQISTDVPSVNVTLHWLQKSKFSCYQEFPLGIPTEQSEWKFWNFRYGEEQLSDFAAKSRWKDASLMCCVVVSVP